MKSQQGGFTLLELILVMTLVGILVSLSSNLFFYQINLWDRLTTHTESLQNSRHALQMLTRDLRQIEAADSIYQASEDSIRFKEINGSTVSYKFSNSQILRNGDLLINDVDDIQFKYYDNSGNLISSPVTDPSQISTISIDMTTAAGEGALSLSTKVKPRNF